MSRSLRRELTAGLAQCATIVLLVSGIAFYLDHTTARHFVVWGIAGIAPLSVLALHLVRHLNNHERFHAPSGVPGPGLSEGAFARYAALDARLRSDPRHGSDYHYVIRPALIAVLADRLARRHGVDLQRDRRRARSLLGDELWSVVVEPAGDGRPEIGAILAAIERIENL